MSHRLPGMVMKDNGEMWHVAARSLACPLLQSGSVSAGSRATDRTLTVREGTVRCDFVIADKLKLAIHDSSFAVGRNGISRALRCGFVVRTGRGASGSHRERESASQRVHHGAGGSGTRVGAPGRSGTENGALHGVPVTVKDSYDVAGLPTRLGSCFAPEAAASEDSAVAQRLRRAGANHSRKDEHAGISYEIRNRQLHHRRSKQSLEYRRTPGGSSGGEAAAIASGCSPGGSAATEEDRFACPRISAASPD